MFQARGNRRGHRAARPAPGIVAGQQLAIAARIELQAITGAVGELARLPVMIVGDGLLHGSPAGQLDRAARDRGDIFRLVVELGTPNIMRGMMSTGDRADRNVISVPVQISDAISTPLLPGPMTSTRLPANGSGTR